MNPAHTQNAKACPVLLVLLLMFLLSLSESSLATSYAFRNQAFSYDTPTAGATTVAWHTNGAAPACTSFPNGDDDWADITFPGGFTFTFNDVNYSGVRIYSNGILAFGNDVSGFHRNWSPTAVANIPQALAGPAGCPRAVPVRLMIPYWTDIVAGTGNNTSGASIRFEVLGSGLTRRLVISWVNVKLYNTSARFNFQVALFESASGVNGAFEYRYTAGSSNGANATVGLYLSSTDFMQYSFNQQFIDTTNGTLIHWYPANQLLPKRSEYRFEEAEWEGIADEVRDTSGNDLHAVRVGNASNVENGRLCRGGSFPGNTLNTQIDAVATPALIGASGSVGFWFNSNRRWSGGTGATAATDAMLIDATAVANRPFFLMKRSTGALRFAVSDSAGFVTTVNTPDHNFAANTWQHVGITWSVRTGTNQTLLQVFINGTLAAFTRSTTSGTQASFSTMHIGDNRTSGVTPANGTPNSANGRIDEVYSYSTDVSGPQFQADMALIANCASLDHFRIIHSGIANCGTARITIEAHDAAHNLYALAGTTMTLSTGTNHGSWSTITAINPVTNTTPGTATYTFANESRVVFALNNPYIETLNINVASGSITERSGAAAFCVPADYTFGTTCDADLSFPRCVSAYECLESGVAFSNLTTTPSSRNPLYTKLAGAAFGIDVVAIDSDGNRFTTHAADDDKTVTVELVDASIQTSDPANVHPCETLPALSPATSTPLTFTKAGQPTDQGRKSATLTVDRGYRDLRCRVTDDSTLPSLVSCSSDNFAVRPGAVTIPGHTPTPAAPSSTGTPTLVAGNTFIVSATTSTSANDGYTGTLTLDASKLSAQETSQDASIASGGTVGALTLNPSLIVNESPSTGRASYGEAGYLYLGPGALRDDTFTVVDQGTGDCIVYDPLNATNTDWLSASSIGGKFGCAIGNQSTVSFGRFRPAAFDTAIPAHGCGTFTYAGQPFPLRVTAMNVQGGTTTNYSGVFASTLTYTDANGAAGLFTPTTLPATAFTAGVADLTVSPSVSFSFANKLMAPATLRLRVTEANGGASSASSNEGTSPLRSGRLRLANAYGSISPLAIPVQAQYWSGSSWVTNANDSCTTLTGIFSAPPANWAWPASSPASTTTLISGIGTLYLTGPKPGSTTVTASGAPAWLRSTWGGVANAPPSASATIGIYAPETRRSVHVQEQF